MTKLFTTLLGRIRTLDTATERTRPPRRGSELSLHPATLRRLSERPQTGGRSPRHR